MRRSSAGISSVRHRGTAAKGNQTHVVLRGKLDNGLAVRVAARVHNRIDKAIERARVSQLIQLLCSVTVRVEDAVVIICADFLALAFQILQEGIIDVSWWHGCQRSSGCGVLDIDTNDRLHETAQVRKGMPREQISRSGQFCHTILVHHKPGIVVTPSVQLQVVLSLALGSLSGSHLRFTL